MATVRQIKIQPRLLLDNGMDSEGNIKTVTVNLNGIKTDVDTSVSADATFILGYAQVLEPVLNKEVNQVQAVSTDNITN